MTDRPTCSCGHDRDARAVQPRLRYGAFRRALAWLVVGAEPKPRAIQFECQVCGETVETTRDPAVLAVYARWPLTIRDSYARPDQ